MMVDIKTPDGSCDAYLASPGGEGRHPLALLYMDAIGLRPRIFDMAERLAGHGYCVLAPNFFYRVSRAPIMDYARLLKPENRPEMIARLGPLVSSYDPGLARRDAAAFLAYGRGLARVDPARPAVTVGYCMGGALALRAAAAFPADFAAVASFHAGHLATDAETSPHRAFGAIRARVYLGHADQDQSMPPEQMEKVEKALAAAGADYRAELYAGARHGWTMKDLPAYDPEAERRHWQAVFDLFDTAVRS